MPHSPTPVAVDPIDRLYLISSVNCLSTVGLALSISLLVLSRLRYRGGGGDRRPCRCFLGSKKGCSPEAIGGGRCCTGRVSLAVEPCELLALGTFST